MGTQVREKNSTKTMRITNFRRHNFLLPSVVFVSHVSFSFCTRKLRISTQKNMFFTTTSSKLDIGTCIRYYWKEEMKTIRMICRGVRSSSVIKSYIPTKWISLLILTMYSRVHRFSVFTSDLHVIRHFHNEDVFAGKQKW